MNSLKNRNDLWELLLLINLAIPLYFMFQEPLPRLLPGMASLSILAFLHIIAIIKRKRIGILASVQLVIILALGLVYHPMYLYLIFLLVYCFNVLSLSSLIGMVAVFASGVIITMAASGHLGSFQFWLNMSPPIFGGSIMPFIIRFSSRYRDMAERLQAATKQVERFAQEEERQRIARELHDTLGHTLSLIVLKAELTEKLAGRFPEKAAAEAKEIRLTASAALKQMRELVSDMKIVKLEDEWEHARTLCAAANVGLSVKENLGSFILTPLQESVIAMCVREALTNVVRHSNASHCQIELFKEGETLRCLVSDNGRGFEDRSDSPGGNGLIGMKQRLGLLEGQLILTGREGKGTILQMEIPIVERDWRKAGSE